MASFTVGVALIAMPPPSSGMDPAVTAAWIAAAVSFLTLIGSMAMQYFGIRRVSKDTGTIVEQQLKHERLRTLNERFATGADRLGADKPPAVRLAAVYAMVGLADGWPENRQVCVDVLCAYLRMPYEPDPGANAPEAEQLAFRGNREVRHTIIRVITAHLKASAPISWQGLSLDFSGVVFDGGSFSGTDPSHNYFDSAVFSGGVVSFEHAEFASGTVAFNGAVLRC